MREEPVLLVVGSMESSSTTISNAVAAGAGAGIAVGIDVGVPVGIPVVVPVGASVGMSVGGSVVTHLESTHALSGEQHMLIGLPIKSSSQIPPGGTHVFMSLGSMQYSESGWGVPAQPGTLPLPSQSYQQTNPPAQSSSESLRRNYV